MTEEVTKVLSTAERKECVARLRTRLNETDDLKHLEMDDPYLERYLYGTEFNTDEAYKKIKLFYELLADYPHWFTKEGPLDKADLIEKEVCVMLPEFDKEGRPIYVYKYGNMDVDTMWFDDITAVDDMWIESLLASNPKVSEKGLSVIIDISNYPYKIIKWMNPEAMRVSAKKMESLPFRDYRFHIVNKSFFIHAAVKIIWPFLPKSMKDRTIFHFDNYESLHQHIDKEVLPEEYGGSKKVLYSDLCSELYKKNEEILKNFQTYRKLN